MTSFGKTALVVEGGAMRSVFSAGVLDGFLSQDFNPFDFYIGVSAGAANLLAFVSGEQGRSLRLFLDFALRKEFISYSRFMRGGHLMDLDWLAQAVFSASELKLQIPPGQQRPIFAGVTDVATGNPVYLQITQRNCRSVIKASVALPVCYRGFPELDGRPMADGGIGQGIPIAEAIRMGAKKIMVVRSRHKYYMKKDTLAHKLIRAKMKAYPALSAAMAQRVQLHQENLALLHNPPPGIRIVEVCPPRQFCIGRFNRNRSGLMNGYRTGFSAAPDAIDEWIELD